MHSERHLTYLASNTCFYVRCNMYIPGVFHSYDEVHSIFQFSKAIFNPHADVPFANFILWMVIFISFLKFFFYLLFQYPFQRLSLFRLLSFQYSWWFVQFSGQFQFHPLLPCFFTVRRPCRQMEYSFLSEYSSRVHLTSFGKAKWLKALQLYSSL